MPVKNFLKSRFSFVSDTSDHTATGTEDNAPDILSIVSGLPLYLQASLSDPSCITTFPSSPPCDREWPTTDFTISINPNSAFFREIDDDVPPNRKMQQSTPPLPEPAAAVKHGGHTGCDNVFAMSMAPKSTTTIQYSGTLHAGGKTLQRTTRLTNTTVGAPSTPSISCNNISNDAACAQVHEETETLFSVTMMAPQPSAASTSRQLLSPRSHHGKVSTLILTDVRYNRVYAVQRIRSMYVGLPLNFQSSRMQADIAVYDVTESYDGCFGGERPAKLILGSMFAVLKMPKRGGGGSRGTRTNGERGLGNVDDIANTATLRHVKTNTELAEMVLTKEDVIGPKGTKTFSCCTSVRVKTGVDPFFPIAVALCRDELCCFNI